MSALIGIILPVFLVIALGYGAVRSGLFAPQGADALMRFAQLFAIPLLLFRAISTLDLAAGYDGDLFLSYYAGSAGAFALGLAGARLIFGRPWADSVAIGFAAFFPNSLLLGLPITELAYGKEALAPNYAIISVHAPILYLVGITSMEAVLGAGGGLVATLRSVSRAIFRNSLMLGIGLGFLANVTGFTLPEPVAAGADLVVRAALPTALFALGGVLVRYRPEGDLRVVAWVCALSLILHPLIAYALASGVFALKTGAVRSAVLTAAMAPGINAYVFSSLYGRAQRVAAASVLAGTLASILSITLWLTILGT